MTGSSPKQNMLYLIRTPPRHSPKVQGRFSLSIHVLKAYFRLLSPVVTTEILIITTALLPAPAHIFFSCLNYNDILHEIVAYLRSDGLNEDMWYNVESKALSYKKYNMEKSLISQFMHILRCSIIYCLWIYKKGLKTSKDRLRKKPMPRPIKCHYKKPSLLSASSKGFDF